MTFNSCVLWTFRQVAQQQINPTCWVETHSQRGECSILFLGKRLSNHVENRQITRFLGIPIMVMWIM